MATRLQSKAGHATGLVSSFTLTFDNGCTPGSTIIVFVAANSGSKTFTASDTPNGAYTTDVNFNGALNSISICSFPNNGSSAALQVTVTPNSGTAQMIVAMQEWSGILTAAPFDQSATKSGTASSTTIGPTPSLSQALEVEVGGIWVNATDSTIAVGGGSLWQLDSNTPVTTTGGGSIALAYNTTSDTSGQSVPFTWTTSTGYRGAIATYKESGIILGAQTVTTTEGTIGLSYRRSPTAYTISLTEGTATSEIDLTLTDQTVTANEGAILFAVNLGATSATFTEGTITAAVSNNQTYALSGINAGFTQGNLSENLSYLLDQNTVIIVGQTAAFSQGSIVAEVDQSVAAFTIAAAEGTLSAPLSISLTAQTITSVEGAITAQAGSNVNNVLASQAITSSQGIISREVDPAVTGQTISAVEGVITFSNVANNFLFPAFTIGATEGVITVTGPPIGTGPPLFIPPQLGKPVTTRTFSWSDMAQRAWGSEFRAPDHRIYQFSGGNYKDSTDMGETGIYRRP